LPFAPVFAVSSKKEKECFYILSSENELYKLYSSSNIVPTRVISLFTSRDVVSLDLFDDGLCTSSSSVRVNDNPLHNFTDCWFHVSEHSFSSFVLNIIELDDGCFDNLVLFIVCLEAFILKVYRVKANVNFLSDKNYSEKIENTEVKEKLIFSRNFQSETEVFLERFCNLYPSILLSSTCDFNKINKNALRNILLSKSEISYLTFKVSEIFLIGCPNGDLISIPVNRNKILEYKFFVLCSLGQPICFILELEHNNSFNFSNKSDESIENTCQIFSVSRTFLVIGCYGKLCFLDVEYKVREKYFLPHSKFHTNSSSTFLTYKAKYFDITGPVRAATLLPALCFSTQTATNLIYCTDKGLFITSLDKYRSEDDSPHFEKKKLTTIKQILYENVCCLSSRPFVNENSSDFCCSLLILTHEGLLSVLNLKKDTFFPAEIHRNLERLEHLLSPSNNNYLSLPGFLPLHVFL
jgi:hypothetical protein